MTRYDAIVIGVGGMGSAALYHLSRRGVRVLGLEQFQIPHDRGSSHGDSRIIRLAYSEHPAYVPLLRRAYELWRELERDAGRRLLITTGGIDAGPEEGENVQGSLRSCRMHDLPHELLDASEVRRRFPGYRLADDMVAVLQRDGGFLLPEVCIEAHVTAARALGAEVRTGEKVLGWQAGAGEVQVSTERTVYRGQRLILTAGAWTRTLVPEFAELAVPERQVVIWTEPRRPELFVAERFPVVNLEAPEGRFYAVPSYHGTGVKFGLYHHRRERVDDPDGVNRSVGPEDEGVIRPGIRRYFPDADGTTLRASTCLFTNSPDGHFIVDHLTELPNVVLAAAFSGHGFKFCSVVGELIADGLRQDPTGGLFRMSRFSARATSDPAAATRSARPPEPPAR